MKKEKDTALILIDHIYAKPRHMYWKRVEVKKRFEYNNENFFVHKTAKGYNATHVTSGRRSGSGKTIQAAIDNTLHNFSSINPGVEAEIFAKQKDWYETEGKNLEVVE